MQLHFEIQIKMLFWLEIIIPTLSFDKFDELKSNFTDHFTRSGPPECQIFALDQLIWWA